MTIACQVADGGVERSEYEAIRQAFIRKAPDTVIALDAPSGGELGRAAALQMLRASELSLRGALGVFPGMWLRRMSV